MNNSNNKFECSICLSKDFDKIIILECGHEFHLECINKWWETGNIYCPLCKQKDKEQEKIKKLNETMREIASKTTVIGPEVSFQILSSVTYCATPNIETQLNVCPETTLEPSTIVRGRYVIGRQFIRVVVNTDDRQVYCFLPIYYNNITFLEIVREQNEKCLCF